MCLAKLPQVRLQHILDQIDGVSSAISHMNFEQIKDNFIYERAVERAVQIISEAVKELPIDLRNKYQDVHWKPIIGIGNLLRHEYYRIKSRDMWEIATVHLPALRPVIVQMLDELNERN
jgi:uncharacterized protein with HEPN domain